MTHKILIIEDEDGIAFMIQDRLISEGYEVEHCSDGLQGEQVAKNNSYDLILLDVMLPGKDGFQICQTLREHNILTPILMLTARSTNIDTIMGLKLGADDYLTKPFDMQILLARIQALLRRSSNKHNATQPKDNEATVTFGEFTLDLNKQELSKQGKIINLNAQEYRLLAFFVNHPNRILSRDELLNEVWGIDSDVSTRTVDVHVAWLRKKIDDLPVAKHLITLRSRGYKFVLS